MVPLVPQSPESPATDRSHPPLPSRLLLTVSWLGPALFLAASGVAKLISPEGEIPALLRELIGPAAYPNLLRVLGLVEIALAALLVPRATRWLGRPLATLLLLLFLALVAFSFDDPEFLSRCGCLGALSSVSRDSLLASPYWLLTRDLVVVWLLAVGWGSDRRRSMPISAGIRRAALLALVLALASAAVGEWRARRAARSLLAAMETGRPRSESLGWTFPDLPLFDAGGHRLSTHEVLSGGETVLIFSPDCPECRREAPTWPALAAAVRATWGRLVLLGAGSIARVIDFLDETGAGELEFYALARPEDAFRAGVFDVPHLVELDGARRVTLQTGFHEAWGLARGITVSLRTDPDLAGALLDGLTRLLFGEDARCDAPISKRPGSFVAAIRIGNRPAGRLAIVSSRPDLRVEAELVVALDPWGTISDLRALRWETGPPDIGEPGDLLAGLVGAKPEAARQRARDEAASSAVEATDWKVIAHLLDRLIDDLG